MKTIKFHFFDGMFVNKFKTLGIFFIPFKDQIIFFYRYSRYIT